MSKNARHYIADESIGGIEPITVDETQASPEVIDMLANLARRVTQLEAQLSATQRNVETFAEQTETNSEDIRLLDDRAAGKSLRFEQDDPMNWRIYKDGVELSGVTSVKIEASYDDCTRCDVSFIAGVGAND